MHEVSIAEGIVSAVLKTLGNHSVPRILSVRVAVGKLAGVDCEALRFAWPSVTRETILEGAELHIERPPGRAWCLTCGKTVALLRHGGTWHRWRAMNSKSWILKSLKPRQPEGHLYVHHLRLRPYPLCSSEFKSRENPLGSRRRRHPREKQRGRRAFAHLLSTAPDTCAQPREFPGFRQNGTSLGHRSTSPDGQSALGRHRRGSGNRQRCPPH